MRARELVAVLVMVAMVVGQSWEDEYTLSPPEDFPLSELGNFSTLGFGIYSEGTSRLGYTLANLGDINGDGFDDLAMGQPYYDSNLGRVTVLFSTASLPTMLDTDLNGTSTDFGYEVGFVVYPDSTVSNQYFGETVAGGGDYNNDGQYDLLIGARGQYNGDGGNPDGSVYVIWGQASHSYTDIDCSIMTNETGIRIHGQTHFDMEELRAFYFGDSMDYIGDFDGDGLDDFIVSAPEDNGAVWVVFGREGPWEDFTISNETALEFIHTSSRNGGLGKNVRGLGDMNGDLNVDLLIWRASRYYDDEDTETENVVIFGGRFNKTGTVDLDEMESGVQGVLIEDAVETGLQGRDFGDGCDVNGDGKADLLLGGRKDNDRRGEVYVIFGKDDLILPDMVLSKDTNMTNLGFKITGANGNDQIAEYGGCLGDLDGDSFEDFFFSVDNRVSMIVYGHAGPFSNSNSSIAGLMSNGFRVIKLDGGATQVINLGNFGGEGHRSLATGDFEGEAVAWEGGHAMVYYDFHSLAFPTSPPSMAPSDSPTVSPTAFPSASPSGAPTLGPSASPSVSPTDAPTASPSLAPSLAPTEAPTLAPTDAPTVTTASSTECTVTIATEGSSSLSWELTDDEGDEEIASGEFGGSDEIFVLQADEEYLLFLSTDTLPSGSITVTVDGDLSQTFQLDGMATTEDEIAGITCDAINDKLTAESDSAFFVTVGVVMIMTMALWF